MITLTEIMNRSNGPLLTVEAEATIREACRFFVEYNVGAFLVEEAGQICGIFTERDLKSVIADHCDPDDITVGDAMSEHVMFGTPSEDALEALKGMAKTEIHHLPVVERDRVLGIVCMLDLIRALHGTDARESEFLSAHACPSCGSINLKHKHSASKAA